MGLDQRDYRSAPPNFGNRRPGGSFMGGSSRLAGTPVVKWLLICNIAIFFLELFTNNAPPVPAGYERDHDSLLWNWGFFSVEAAKNGQVWRLFTFQFLHADGWHLFGNMIGLFFFGPIAERWWGSKKFIFFYLVCGVAGALFYTILFLTPGLLPSSMAIDRSIGASAGVYGVLIAVAVIAPNLKVFLYFILPISIRFLAIGFLCFAIYRALTGGVNAGGEAGHIGGAILAFILMKKPQLLSFLSESSGAGNSRRVIDATVVRERKVGPRININMDDSEVDRILDKVNREGVQSLSDEEKETLKRSAGM